jgi:hypothetical protein
MILASRDRTGEAERLTAGRHFGVALIAPIETLKRVHIGCT